MADISDVENTFATLITEAVYPNGEDEPSIVGEPITILSGFPIRTNLDQLLQNNQFAIAIFPTGQDRNITTFERNFIPLNKVAPTLLIEINDTTIILNGTVTVPQTVVLIVNQAHYFYAVTEDDTLETICIALAELIPNAMATDNEITISGAYSIQGSISTPYTAGAELLRIERLFVIRIWCPVFETRPLVAQAVLQKLLLNYRIAMPDDFYSYFMYSHSTDVDDIQKLNTYTRDIYFKVQYATTIINSYPSVVDAYVDPLSIN